MPLRRLICRNAIGVRTIIRANSTTVSSLFKPDLIMVKKLRNATDAPFKDIKSALAASRGDYDGAFEWLRKKGIAAATAKSSRSALEGLVGIIVDKNTASMVQVNSETDFVARNEKFQTFVVSIALSVQSSSQLKENCDELLAKDELLALTVDNENGRSGQLAQIIPELVAKVGENIVIQRACKVRVDEGIIASYLHNSIGKHLGRIGALVAISFPKTIDAKKQELIKKAGQQLAMHIAAAKPKYLNSNSIPCDTIENERRLLSEQVQQTGKLPSIIEKIIQGKLEKYYSEVTLVEQNHLVHEGNPKVRKVLEILSNDVGAPVDIVGFQRFEVGEDAGNLECKK
uniref:Elongation factor Ts, mitochondrial n=1 Tax=Albugo laibachii Nc14 TaxID=890382 RepID=F0WPF0_9STRA|nr:elongation factor Ts putative [Albugo laibachii Nc14]|eukprot:CCA23197.1 elongation factor Ts putative [Albugo laibachii Nc14]